MTWLLWFAALYAGGLVVFWAADVHARRTASAPESTDPCAESRAASSALRAECRALPGGDFRG
ncbi:hypothetical protein ACFY8S_09295 [Streptomyces hygroscopicus]|uniref:hypothetical protein n=1 Tax=Streptomyces hygroscopicus TaxID=1912 RepID=UPI0036797492